MENNQLVERLKNCYTGAIYDVLRERGIKNTILPHSIKSIDPSKKLAGVIWTCSGEIDETLDKDDVFGTVEAVKTVSDLFLPMSGKIIEFNENLSDSPESINDSPYDEGWIIKVEVSNVDEMSELLDNNQYKDLIG